MSSQLSKIMASAIAYTALTANNISAEESLEPIQIYEHQVTLESCTADNYMASILSVATIETHGFPSNETDKRIDSAIIQANSKFFPYFSQTLEGLTSHDIKDAQSGSAVDIIEDFYEHAIKGYKKYTKVKIEEQASETPFASIQIKVSKISVENKVSSECLPEIKTIEI